MATRKIFTDQEFQPSAFLVNPKVHSISDLSQHSGSVGQLVTYSANLYFHDGSNWFTLIESNYSGNLTGAPNFDPSSGSIPFTVASGKTGRVDNLNADYLDGYDTSTTATSSAIPVYGTGGVLKVATPISGSDAASKLYVDNAIQGLDIKPSVAAATTASITLSGNQTIDGVSITAGMRVLVKDQSTASENGIYVSSASAWALAEDSDSQSLSDGAYVFVENGTTHNNTGWTYVNDGAYTWVQFSGAGQITAGDGLTKTGDTLNASVASPLSISNDQITIADGAISGVKLDSGIAGDGLAFSTGVLSVNVSAPLSISADTLTIADGAIGGAKLNTAIAGDGLAISAGVLSVNTTGPISIVNDDLTIADGAITGVKLDSAIAGNGIGFGSGVMSVNVTGPITIVNDLVTIEDGALTGAKLADNTVTSTQLANSITVTDLLVQDVSLATLIVGSTGGAGAELILDGAANGDGSGGDFAYIKMTSGDDLHIVNQQTAGTMLFATGSVTRATIAADGKVKLFQNTGIGGDPSSTYTLYAYGNSKIGGSLRLDSAVISTPAAYSANQDEAYLIAGTSGYTGATTNWNTFGIQHRFKTDSGGVPRVTIDASGGERFYIDNNGRGYVSNDFGIGTAPNTSYKLSVSGNANFTGTISAATPTATGHLATKGYVDSQVSAATPSVALPISYNASSEITIADQAITGAKLANNTVTSTQLADDILLTSLGIGNFSGVSVGASLHARGSSTVLAQIEKTDSGSGYIAIGNSTTGVWNGSSGATGMIVGIDSNEHALLWNRGSKNVRIGTNNTERITVESDGDVKVHNRLGVGGTPVSVLSLVSGSRTLDFELKDTPASGDQGIQLIGGSGDSIGIAAGGTGPGLVLDTSNRLGIRTDSMSSQDSTADDLVVGDGLGHYGITLYSAATYKGTIAFGDPNSNYQGAIVYDHNNDSLALFTGGTSRLSIDSSGNGSITGTFSAATPTATGHLATKGYVDSSITNNAAAVAAPVSFNLANQITIADGALTGAKLANNTVTSTQLADDISLSTLSVSGGNLRLGTANTASGHINSYELMTFNIDTDNDDTNRYFKWSKDGESGSGTELMLLDESGNLKLSGDESELQFNSDTQVGNNIRARIKCVGVSSTYGYGGDLLFFTTADNNTSAERMRLTSSGELQLTGNGVLKNQESGGNFSYLQQTSSDARLFVQYSQPLLLGTAATTRLTIEADGDVQVHNKLGVGLTPTVQLHVSNSAASGGTFKFTDGSSRTLQDLAGGILSWSAASVLGSTSWAGTADHEIKSLTTARDTLLVVGPTSGSEHALHVTGLQSYFAGKLGVNVTNPYGRFEVALNPTTSSTTVNETADFTDKFVISNASSSPTFGDRIPLVFNVNGYGTDNISAAIVGERATSSTWNTELSFWVNGVTAGTEGTDAIQEGMRLTSTGLGIGCAPTELLTLKGQGQSVPTFAIQRTYSTDTQFRITLAENSAATTTRGTSTGQWANVIDSTNSNLFLTSKNAGGTGGSIILDADKVGVGVTPSYPLDFGTGGSGNHIRARRIWASGTGTDSGFTLDNTLIYKDSGGKFVITNPGSYPNSAFSIDTSGNTQVHNKLGVGRSPSYRLDVFETSTSPASEPTVSITRSNNLASAGQTAYNPELFIKGHSSNYKIACKDQNNNNLFYVKGNGETFIGGNVGIGTASPSAKLNVAGDVLVNTGYSLFTDAVDENRYNDTTGSGGIAVNAYNFNGSSGGPNIQIANSYSSGWANIYTNKIGAGTDVANASNRHLAMYTDGVAAWSITVNSNYDLAFLNSQTGNLLLDPQSDGNVGIGTASPQDKLDVNGTVRCKAPTGSDWAMISYNSSGNAASGIWYSSYNAELLLRDASSSLDIRLNTGGGSYINTGYGFGIGTTSPSYMLDVAGEINTSSTYKISGNNVVAKRQFVVSLPTGSGYSSSYFYPVHLLMNYTSIGSIDNTYVSIQMPSQSGGASYNSHSLYGWIVAGGWTDHPSYCDAYHTYYDSNERSILGVYRGTQNTYGPVIYLRGGLTYYITTTADTVNYSASAYTSGNATFAVKNPDGSDYSGTSANISRLFDTYNSDAGRLMPNNVFVNGNMSVGSTSIGGKLYVKSYQANGTYYRADSAYGRVAYIDDVGNTGRLGIGYAGYTQISFGGGANNYINNSYGLAIGSTDPGSYKLYVNGTSYHANNIHAYGVKLNYSTSEIYWPHTSGNNSSRSWNIIGEQGSYGKLSIKRSALSSATVDTEVLNFYNDSSAIFTGSVGVGNASPQDVLHVQGGIIAEGTQHSNTNSSYPVSGLATFKLFGKRKTDTSTNLGGIGMVYSSGYEDPIIYGYDNNTNNRIYFGSMGAGNRDLGTGFNPIAVVDTYNDRFGIGAINPNHKLEVLNHANSETFIRVNNQNSGTSAYTGLDLQSYGGGWQVKVPANTSYVNPLIFSFNNSERMQLSADGSLGINVTPSSSYKLHVNGNSLVTGNTYIGSSHYLTPLTSNIKLQTPYGYLSYGPANTSWCHITTDRPSFYFNASLTVDGSSTIQSYYQNDLKINAASNSNRKIIFQSGGASYAAMDATGKWGLGTLSPSEQLHVAGNALISSHMMLRSASSNHQGIGFNRNVQNGAIYGSANYAYQLQNLDNIFEVQQYNGSGTFISYPFRALSGEVVINDSGTDLNFRVESSSSQNMLFVDAGLSRIGVGTGSPSATLHVAGTAKVTSTLDVSAISVNGTTTANRYLGTNSSGTLEWKTASSNPYITNISMGGFVVSQNKDWVNVNTTLTYNTGATISDSATIVMTTLNCPDDCATGS